MRKLSKQIPRHRELINRGLYLKGAALGALGFCTRSAVDVEGLRREWIEVVETDLQLQNLPQGLEGTRIAHISDLHYSRTVSSEYLRRCVERLNSLNVDIVLLTGDYITYDIQGRFRERVIDLLGEIRSRYGVYACLGNHDYGVRSLPDRRRDYFLYRLIRGMEGKGITVLRNESTALNIHGCSLWLVGLGDLRAGDFHPHRAFADVPSENLTFVLVHNPRGVEYLGRFDADVVVSGHTHGWRPKLGSVHVLRIIKRRFHAGMYDVEGTKLYVNRGLGRVGRMRLNSRPEITILTLH
jgi:predicted MPP superfamily phosphohydrolase